jgi:hypothetical protein
MSTATRPCEICGQAIDPERVDVLPDTRLCREHARQIQKYGGEFLVSFSLARLGKAGSLKKNYGDVSMNKRRNLDGLQRLREEHESAAGL